MLIQLDGNLYRCSCYLQHLDYMLKSFCESFDRKASSSSLYNPETLLLLTAGRWETQRWSRCCFTDFLSGKNRNLSSQSPSPPALPLNQRVAALYTSFKDNNQFCLETSRKISIGWQRRWCGWSRGGSQRTRRPEETRRTSGEWRESLPRRMIL